MNHYDDDNFKTMIGLDGEPVSVLKDKGRLRISMTTRDAVVGIGSRDPRGQQPGDICTINGSEGRLRRGADGNLVCVPLRSSDAKPQFTDGRTTDPLALQRPGFRIPVVYDRRAVHDAYAADAAYQRNRYKCGDGERLCDDCDGEGYDQDGNACDTCHGKGVMPEVEDKREPGKSLPDPASDAQTIRDHHQTMDQLYREHDVELGNAWRTTK